MNRRDIVIGLVILAILAGVVYLRRKGPEEELTVPRTLSVEDKIEEKFDFEIPEDVDKAELKDVTGGTASAIATRKFAEGKFQHSILADLADPETGKFYEGWLVKGEEGEEGFSLISTGKLRLAKGGFMLDFESSTDYTDHSQVVVTLEEKFDNTPEKHILEGGF